MLAADWADARAAPVASRVCRALCFCLFAAAIAALLFLPSYSAGPRFSPALALRIAGAVLGLASLILLASSLFFELRPAPSDAAARLVVSTGTYALCRHPGVLWLFGLHASLVLVSGSTLLLVALPFWTAANLALVIVEDRVFFPRIFGDAYLRYQQSAPFLIPNRTSAREALATLSRALRKRKDSRRNTW
jgi:protein-S-isoprenylcysteine O-methyltransferase Ste14